MTMLDRAYGEMEAGGDTERLRFYERLADAELFLLLEREAEGGRIAPQVFPLEEGPVVLAFDTEDRLAEFSPGAAYAAMTGRALAEMLAGQGLGVGLNLIKNVSVYTLNKLLVFTQPAHLELDGALAGVQSNAAIARADYVRRELDADAERSSS